MVPHSSNPRTELGSIARGKPGLLGKTMSQNKQEGKGQWEGSAGKETCREAWQPKIIPCGRRSEPVPKAILLLWVHRTRIETVSQSLSVELNKLHFLSDRTVSLRQVWKNSPDTEESGAHLDQNLRDWKVPRGFSCAGTCQNISSGWRSGSGQSVGCETWYQTPENGSREGQTWVLQKTGMKCFWLCNNMAS